MNKKGMEMWQLVLIIIALLLLFFAITWFSLLNNDLGELLGSLERLL